MKISSSTFRIFNERFLLAIIDRIIEIYDMTLKSGYKIYSYTVETSEELNIQKIILGGYKEQTNQFSFILIPYDGFKISIITSDKKRLF